MNMTQDKFLTWLEGYLDGKETEVASNDSLKTIKEKLEQLQTSDKSYSIPYGTNTSYTTTSTNFTYGGKQLLNENEG